MVKVIESLFDSYGKKFIYNIILVFVFTIAYKMAHELIPDSFNTKLSFSETFYFTCVTNFTLGYGDVLPTNVITKTLVCIHVFLFWLIMTA